MPCASDVTALEVVPSSCLPSPFRSQPGVRSLPDDNSGHTVTEEYNDVVLIPCGGTRVKEFLPKGSIALVGSERDISYTYRTTVSHIELPKRVR